MPAGLSMLIVLNQLPLSYSKSYNQGTTGSSMWLEPAGEGALSFILHWWDEEQRSVFLYLEEKGLTQRG